MFGGSGKVLSFLDGFRGPALVVQADPLLGELVGLALHSRLHDGEVLGNGDADPVQNPEQGPLVVLYQLLVDHLEGLHAAPVEEALPGGVVLVDAQLQVVYRCEAETQPLPADLFVRVPAPLLGLERLPQGDSLAGGVPAADPDEPPQVRQHGGRHPARTDAPQPRRPARQADEVAEVGPHYLGPEYAVLCRAPPQRLLHEPLEVGRSPRIIPARRVHGVTATVLTQNVLELGIVQKRPYLRVVRSLEVVARLSRPSRLQQHLEVLIRVARDPRAV